MQIISNLPEENQSQYSEQDLIDAIEVNDFDLVNIILKIGFSFFMRNKKLNQMLVRAAYNHEIELEEALLRLKIIDPTDCNYNPVWTAGQYGRLHHLKTFETHKNIDKSKFIQNVFRSAVIFNHIDTIKYYLTHSEFDSEPHEAELLELAKEHNHKDLIQLIQTYKIKPKIDNF